MRRNGKVYIAEALIFMLLTDDLDEIKICDICRRAGVSRMTFYRHFNNKQEILEFYMDYLYEEFVRKDRSYPRKQFRSPEHIEECLDYFRQHAAFAICLYKAGLESIMLKAINRYMEMIMKEDFSGKKGPKTEEEKKQRAFCFYAYAGAIYNCFMQWIISDFQPDSAAMAQSLSQVSFSLTSP